MTLAQLGPGLDLFVRLDLPAMLTATLAALACGVLGNFLVLRRQSLMGDAISHSVLPGLVAGFLASGERTTVPMFIGAAVAGVVTVVLVELVRKLGRVEAGAAMGVVFSVLFAAGVVLIRVAAAEGVDLDPDCVLNGALEDVFWALPAGPLSVGDLFTAEALAGLPRELLTVAAVAALAGLFVAVLFKELRIAAFDPALATSLGFNAGWLHYALMIFVAAAVVASFEAVGSILVIAMLVCPAATARLLTDRLAVQVWLSAALAVVSGVGGYVLAVFGPGWVGRPEALGAAGMITVVAGVLFAGAVVLSPTHGVVAARVRRRRLSVSIAREDLLGLLYRAGELDAGRAISAAEATNALGGGSLARRAVRSALADHLVQAREGSLALTEAGFAAAQRLVRTHRLWEHYLVEELGLRADHVHTTAERLEHVTDERMREALGSPPRDPHNRPIPPTPGRD